MACEWIMDGISFQKIYGLCGLKGHIVEIRGGVTLVDGRTDGRTTECEDRARILETEFAILFTFSMSDVQGQKCHGPMSSMDGMEVSD